MKQPEPLPQDIAQLLERSATLVEPPTSVRARLRQRLTTALVGPVALLQPPATSGFRGLSAAVGHGRALIGLAGFMVGAATVWALRSPTVELSRPVLATPAVVAPEIAQSPTPAAPPAQSQPTLAAAAAASEPTLPRRAVSRAPNRAHLEVAVAEKPAPAAAAVQTAPLLAPETHWGLQAEGELLQKGRTAMVRGDTEGALAAVEEHATRFPRGKLAEEREALKVQALVAEDRAPEARAALGAFQRNYPKSLLGPALQEAVVGRVQ